MRSRTLRAVVSLSFLLLVSGAARAAGGPAPVRFEPNRGQADPRWEYIARTTAGEIVLGAAEARIGAAALTFPGATEGGAWEPVERLPGEASYLLGDDPSRWILGVPAFGGVVRRNMYPGIDVTLRGAGRRVDLELTAAAGADASAIAIELDGKRLSIDRGALRIDLPDTALPPERPRLGSDAEANLYVAGRVVGQAATAYVTMLEPSGKDVVRTTYLDGLDEASPIALAVSPTGEVAVAGSFGGDAVVVRIDRSGRSIVRRTALGGRGADAASAIAFAREGGVWVVGTTASADFPVSHDAFQPFPGGDTDGFVARIDASGEVRFASYLGGAEADEARSVAVDRDGDTYVAGMRGPVASVTRLDAKGSLVYARTLAGEATAVAITPSGDLVIAGTFVARLDAAGVPTFTTELSGRADAVALDRGEVAWVAGTRGSDAFVGQISLSKRTTLDEKTFRGDRDDVPGGVLVDGNGDGFVAGYTTSTDLPEAEQPEATRGAGVFVAKVEGVEPAPLGACPGTRNFDGNVSSAWEVKENWSGDTLPVAGDSVCISGFNVVMGGSSSVGSVRLEGGSLTINSGVTLTVAAASEFTGSLTINNGTLTGAGNRTTSGSFTFTAGTLSGAGITTSTGPVSLSGAGAKGLFGHRWDTNTTVTWTGTGSFGLSSLSVVNNAGTWDAQSDATLSWPVGSAPAFNNSGTFKKSAGTGTTTLAAPFHNTGSVLVQTGTLNSTAGGSGSTSWDVATGTTLGFGGGTYHLTAGTTLTGAGRVLLNGAELDVETAVSMPASMTFEMSGGFLGAGGDAHRSGSRALHRRHDAGHRRADVQRDVHGQRGGEQGRPVLARHQHQCGDGLHGNRKLDPVHARDDQQRRHLGRAERRFAELGRGNGSRLQQQRDLQEVRGDGDEHGDRAVQRRGECPRPIGNDRTQRRRNLNGKLRRRRGHDPPAQWRRVQLECRDHLQRERQRAPLEHDLGRQRRRDDPRHDVVRHDGRHPHGNGQADDEWTVQLDGRDDTEYGHQRVQRSAQHQRGRCEGDPATAHLERQRHRDAHRGQPRDLEPRRDQQPRNRGTSRPIPRSCGAWARLRRSTTPAR
jgi:hypothetical protein